MGGSLGRIRMMTVFNFTDFMYRPRRRMNGYARGGGVSVKQPTRSISYDCWVVGRSLASGR